MYRVNVLENVINRRQGKKNKRRTVSTFIEKRGKPELEKILFYFRWRSFCLTMMYLLKKFRNSQTKSSPGNLDKFHCNRKEIQREGAVGVVLLREEKAVSGQKKILL